MKTNCFTSLILWVVRASVNFFCFNAVDYIFSLNSAHLRLERALLMLLLLLLACNISFSILMLIIIKISPISMMIRRFLVFFSCVFVIVCVCIILWTFNQYINKNFAITYIEYIEHLLGCISVCIFCLFLYQLPWSLFIEQNGQLRLQIEIECIYFRFQLFFFWWNQWQTLNKQNEANGPQRGLF